MSEKLFKDVSLHEQKRDGSSTCVMAIDSDTLAEKCAAVMSVLVEQTNGPEEALAILLTMTELLKRENGISRVDVEIVPEKPQ
jgi:hypothetical protein